jgi:hypothetical protein
MRASAVVVSLHVSGDLVFALCGWGGLHQVRGIYTCAMMNPTENYEYVHIDKYTCMCSVSSAVVREQSV